MSIREVRPPEVLPILSRGRHRSPRRGACFMEMASYLAGERWSDHPACTHALLASLARHVNDRTSDAERPRLATLIPSVIGLTSDDPRVDVRLAMLCASTGLPVVAEERQRVLAVALLAGERVLADLDGRDLVELSEQTRTALAHAPLAARWGQRFAGQDRTTARAHRRHAAPHVVGYAVHGIAQACVADPDAVLRDLLTAAIDQVRAVARDEVQPVEQAAWEAACALTRG